MSDPKSDRPVTGARYLNADGQTVYVDSDEHLFAFDAQLNGFKLDELDRFLERDLDPSIGYDTAAWQKLTRLRSQAFDAYKAKDFDGSSERLRTLARMMSELGGKRAGKQREREQLLVEGAARGASAIAPIGRCETANEAKQNHEEPADDAGSDDESALRPDVSSVRVETENWRLRMQQEATRICIEQRATGAQPGKRDLAKSLVKWSTTNNFRTSTGAFPTVEYIRTSALNGWDLPP